MLKFKIEIVLDKMKTSKTNLCFDINFSVFRCMDRLNFNDVQKHSIQHPSWCYAYSMLNITCNRSGKRQRKNRTTIVRSWFLKKVFCCITKLLYHVKIIFKSSFWKDWRRTLLRSKFHYEKMSLNSFNCHMNQTHRDITRVREKNTALCWPKQIRIMAINESCFLFFICFFFFNCRCDITW